MRKVWSFSQSVYLSDYMKDNSKKSESNVTLYEGSPLQYILIVAKPKEHYLDSSNNNKATGAVRLQNKISDRRVCGGDMKARLISN